MLGGDLTVFGSPTNRAERRLKMIPYFKWFPAEMEAETNFRCMTLEERGLFITCLNLAWVNNGLPSDLGELARMLRVNRNKLDKLWRGRVGVMFEHTRGRLRNTRQELDRQEVEYKSLTAAESANVRWKRNATKKDSQCLRTDTDTEQIKKQMQNRTDADFYNDEPNWADNLVDPHPGRRPEAAPPTPVKPAMPLRPKSDLELSEEELEAKYGSDWRSVLQQREFAAARRDREQAKKPA